MSAPSPLMSASAEQTLATTFVNDEITRAAGAFIKEFVSSDTLPDHALDAFYATCIGRLKELKVDLENQSSVISKLAKQLFKKFLNTEFKKRPDSEKNKILAARDEFFKRLIRDILKEYVSNSPLSITKAGFEQKSSELTQKFKHIPASTISAELTKAIRGKFPEMDGFTHVKKSHSNFDLLPDELIANILSFLDREKDIGYSEITCKRLWNISNLSPHSTHWQILFKKHFPDISPLYAIPCGIQLKHVVKAMRDEILAMQDKTNTSFQLAVTKKIEEIGKLSAAEQESKRVVVFGPNFTGAIDSIHPSSMMGLVKNALVKNDQALKASYNRQPKFNSVFKSIFCTDPRGV